MQTMDPVSSIADTMMLTHWFLQVHPVDGHVLPTHLKKEDPKGKQALQSQSPFTMTP